MAFALVSRRRPPVESAPLVAAEVNSLAVA
jgi:hypothetical protein